MSRSAYWRVSVIAMNGLAFDLSTPHGRMMATIIAGIADFERELLQERIRSGIAAAKAPRQAPRPPARTAAEIRPPHSQSSRPGR
jgi:DNA invertase Pin-like site-specific DNA recombinase